MKNQEVQIKILLRFYFTHSTLSKLKKSDNNKCWRD